VDDEETRAPGSVDIEIFGRTYRVRGRDDGGYLQQVADLVDRKMREVAERSASTDPGRLAILAALNIADELLQSQNRQEGERVEIRERVTALTGQLTAVLES